MKIGIGLPNQIRDVNPAIIPQWAVRAEDAGFSTLATVGRTAYPGVMDTVALAGAAAVTRSIALSSNVMLTTVSAWGATGQGACRHRRDVRRPPHPRGGDWRRPPRRFRGGRTPAARTWQTDRPRSRGVQKRMGRGARRWRHQPGGACGHAPDPAALRRHGRGVIPAHGEMG